MMIDYTADWQITGHAWAVRHIARSLSNDRIRHAYLISGPAGIGKTTFARNFAMAMNCLSKEKRPCGVCRACQLIREDHHADVNIIQGEGERLKVDQVRALQAQLSMRPVEGRYRVVILRRFHTATAEAMDALLKTLEEPAPAVLLLLTADTTDNLLPTIRSRCQPINLRLLPVPLVRKLLEEQHLIKPEQAALLAALSGGRPGWAVRAAGDETVLGKRSEWLKQLEDALSMSRVGRFGLAEQISKDKDTLRQMLELWQSYWRDALHMANTTVTPITNRDHDHALRQIATKVQVDDILKALNAVQRTAKYLDENVNTRLSVEVLLLDLPRLRLNPAPPGMVG
ncbi:MAG: DNA polymerase III subunit delta' [Anaerolineae bacterium]|nr:DNA polymerase III subunit delta' [Anaerolineae bacterium]